MTNSTTMSNGDWSVWAKFVLKSLEELKQEYLSSEKKIEDNRDAFIEAVNKLELAMVKQVGEIKAEIKIINNKMAIRSIVWSSIIPAIAAIIMLIIKFFA